MTDENSSVPTVLNPYRDTATMYRNSWFRGALPLPYREKHPPPMDFTKRISPYPDDLQIEKWCNDGKQHNICVRLAGVDEDHELLGIDVDDYIKGDRKKNGWDQLKALEAKLGPLPETWISSARVDGKSGIRYFRVPRGLAFRGKVDEDIEVIRKGHRFAVVWPSIHPDGGTYWWFPPGVLPSADGRKVWDGNLPIAKQFPVLGEAWINYLTNNRTKSVDDGLIDVDSSVDEIYQWATDTFHGHDDHPVCGKMREKLDLHLAKIEKATALHDLLTAGHWNILHLAFEGHLGWNQAINELESAFVKKVAKDGGSTERDNHTLHGEIFRSRVQALRQIKGKVDERIKIGAKAIDPLCTKVGICGTVSGVDKGKQTVSQSTTESNDSSSVAGVPGSDVDSGSVPPPDELDDVPRGFVKGVPEYRTNDDGNAEHLIDMFSTLETGPSLRYASGYGWIVWHNGTSEDSGNTHGGNLDGSVLDANAHWELDSNGDQIVRRMWQRVRNRQEGYTEACYGDLQTKARDLLNGQNGVTEADVKDAAAKHRKWSQWSEKSGNNHQAQNAVKAAQSLPGVSISVNALDQNSYLLGVANGVLELTDEVRLRPARPDDYITLNTRVAWKEDGGSPHAKSIWQNYLDTFLPDPALQQVVQVVLGHCIIGGNPNKLMIVLKGDPNTGKSTMIAAIEAAMGDYCKTVNQSIFQRHKLNPVLANSITKRIIVCSEFDEKDQLSASQIKQLTGGSDKIEAELKGSNITIEEVPQFVPILATNEVPTIVGADKALENRLYIIPFNVTPSTLDKKGSTIITKVCGEAVLSWLVEGYKQYRMSDELPYTDEIRRGTKSFVSELDEIQTFAHECVMTQESPEGYVSRRAMFDKFEQWWGENRFQSNQMPSKTKFTRRMKAIGFKTKDKNFRNNEGVLDYWWFGVKLGSPPSNVLNLPTSLGRPVVQNVQRDEQSTTDKNPS